MLPFLLDECRPLFKDELRYQEFLALLIGKLKSDFSPVIAGKEVLGAVLSPHAVKEVLYERMIQKLSESPTVLEEIKDRLENDRIVE